MSGIKGKNSLPEMLVRKALFAMGYRFRLHRRDLPGTPDIAMPGRRITPRRLRRGLNSGRPSCKAISNATDAPPTSSRKWAGGCSTSGNARRAIQRPRRACLKPCGAGSTAMLKSAKSAPKSWHRPAKPEANSALLRAILRPDKGSAKQPLINRSPMNATQQGVSYGLPAVLRRKNDNANDGYSLLGWLRVLDLCRAAL